MGKRLTVTICCAFAAILANSQAIGADLPPAPPPMAPPPPPPVEQVSEKSCIYARIDGGYAFHERPRVFKNGGGGYSEALGEKLDENYLIDVGVGCYFNDYFRADLTVGYRSSTDLTDAFNSLDAEVESYTAMINAYFDIGHFGGVTPYVGVGVGLVHNRLHSIRLPAGQLAGSDTDFAWALHVGASVQLTDTMLLDASYRYIDLGDVAGDSPTDTLTVEKLRAHDIRIGLRINFTD